MSISEKSSSRGVAGEDVGEARLDADPDEREPARLLPPLRLRELGVAELLARLGIRERHRHVEVGAPRVERGLEDRRVEARVDGVQDRVRTLGAGELGDRRRVGGVDGGGSRSARRRCGSIARPRAILVDVGEHHPLEEVTAMRDRGDRGPDSTRPDDENAHAARRYVR